MCANVDYENKLENAGHNDCFSQVWFGMDDENANS